MEVSPALVANHLPVLMSLKKIGAVSKPPPIPWYDNYTFHKRLINEEILPRFREALHRVDWTPVLADPDPLHSFQTFHSRFLEIFNFYFPLLTKSKPKLNSKKGNRGSLVNDWYTPELG